MKSGLFCFMILRVSGGFIPSLNLAMIEQDDDMNRLTDKIMTMLAVLKRKRSGCVLLGHRGPGKHRYLL